MIRTRFAASRRSPRVRQFFTAESLESRRLFATVPANFDDQSFGTAFANGTAMAFAPDGRLFALEQGGTIRVIQNNGTTTTAGSVATTANGERGLLGIAFDPAFASNGYLYLYYTSSTGGAHNRVSRFTLSGNAIVAGSEFVLVNLENLSGATNHNGGAINFGPDGKLYVAVGDNANSANAQSITSRFGKILRYNADGTIPADNPTSISGINGTPSGIYSAIWAAGLRNPYTFAFNPVDGKMFINDVGEVTWEEINVGIAGRNYGWPTTEGYFTPTGSTSNFTPPFYTYQHGGGLTNGFAITGGAFYNSNAANAFPNQYQGKYFFGEYVSDWIGSINPAGPAQIPQGTAPNFASNAGGTVDIDVGPDGALYYLSRDTIGNAMQGVRRIVANFSPSPAIITQPVSKNAFVGQNVTFFVETSGQNLQYQWTRNGTNITGANSASYTLSDAQLADSGAQFRVVVSNTLNTIISNAATLNVTADAAPVPTITLPTGSTLYIAGQSLLFAGSASDPEDGTLGAAALSWRIDFHHDTHTHPFYPLTNGIASGSVTIPTSGETAANVWYRVYLTATDSAGRSTTIFRDVFPRTANIVLKTGGFGVAGTTTTPSTGLLLDGIPITSGDATGQAYTVLGVTGIVRTIEAPATQVFSGQTYQFQSWSDGGARSHTISTPSADTNYIATYKDITLPAVTAGVFGRDRTNFSSTPHSLTFNFSEPIAANAPTLTILDRLTGTTTNVAAPPTVGTDAKSLRYTFASAFPNGILPDGRYRATFSSGGAKDAAGNLTGVFTYDFTVLSGDVDSDADVDFDDLLIIARNFNATGKLFAEGNLNYSPDGSVNFDDLLVLAKNFNRTLPVPAALQATSLPSARKRTSAAETFIV